MSISFGGIRPKAFYPRRSAVLLKTVRFSQKVDKKPNWLISDTTAFVQKGPVEVTFDSRKRTQIKFFKAEQNNAGDETGNVVIDCALVSFKIHCTSSLEEGVSKHEKVIDFTAYDEHGCVHLDITEQTADGAKREYHFLNGGRMPGADGNPYSTYADFVNENPEVAPIVFSPNWSSREKAVLSCMA